MPFKAVGAVLVIVAIGVYPVFGEVSFLLLGTFVFLCFASRDSKPLIATPVPPRHPDAVCRFCGSLVQGTCKNCGGSRA